MRLKTLVGERLRENPADIQIKSQIFMLRAGYIKPVSNGSYTLSMPAKKAVNKIENIIREEMDAIDGQETLFPVVLPKELLAESGRYTSIGAELVRFKDRGGRDLVLGMTHEEAAVHFVRNNVVSHHQLPLMVYQIQTKFRDEPRCRGGLIRVREFTMKDAYSFHLKKEDLDAYYQKCNEAYMRIFRRIGLKNFIAVASDTGMMGGEGAHEYMLLTPVGEDTLCICPHCGYKANIEVAETVLPEYKGTEKSGKLSEVDTGEAKTIEEVSALLKVPEDKTVKAVVFGVKDENTAVIAFLKGDCEVNEAKLKKVTGKNIVPCLAPASVGLYEGNIGPLGLGKDIITVYDNTLKGLVNAVAGANKPKKHLINFCAARELKNAEFFDISKVKDGGICPECGKALELKNGIEIGNIFKLGDKYTKSMGMSVLNDTGEAVVPIMGCYGIGVGRALASVIEESNDEKGLIFPYSIAPFYVHLVAIKNEDEKIAEYAETLYNELKKSGIEVLYDDRFASAGVKLSDADLMGMPIRLVVSPKMFDLGSVEFTERATRATETVERKDIVRFVKDKIALELKKLS